MFKNIIVAYDGSDQADHALDYATQLALENDAHVALVYAFDPMPAWVGTPDFPIAVAVEPRIAYSEALLDKAEKRLHEAGITTVEQDILEGPAPDAIVQAADVRHADLIIMGTRGMGMLQGLLMGSVSERVIGSAHCPVLVVK